jgi:aminoglycoside phosphotransferase family enzyme
MVQDGQEKIIADFHNNNYRNAWENSCAELNSVSKTTHKNTNLLLSQIYYLTIHSSGYTIISITTM